MNAPAALWRRLLASTLATSLALVLVILLAASAAFYFLEFQGEADKSFFDALWWAMVTLSTVGYGDIVPTTVAGRLVAMAIMATGVGVMATLTGSLASVLIERKNRKRQGLLPVKTSDHCLVLGVNAQAPELLRALAAAAPDKRGPAVVLVAPVTPEAFEEMAADLDLGDRLGFCRGNPAHEPTLGRASPETARSAYILSQDDLSPEDADQQTLLTALTFRGLAPKVRLCAEALLEASRKPLSRAGVDVTVVRGELAGRALGAMGEHPALWHFLERLLGGVGGRAMTARTLSAEEKALPFSKLVARSLEAGGEMPVAVFRLRRDIDIRELLDADSALDRFIAELFAAYGQDGRIGSEGPRVVVNPGDGLNLADYDGLIVLRRGGEARDGAGRAAAGDGGA
ncbi:potassium channel family protein [Solidesulfovibrio sp.]|uniref:potassium channel family protein n=1 Tax=Solidesulfovibrio sp. TaxID=2910990 RepID=UPI0026261018|nr:potassium channel family protein [Solidesulfovibrio sp.]